jgi:ribosomal protein L35
MPKQKTHSGAKKRFKRKRAFTRDHAVSKNDTPGIKRLLGLR